MRHSRLGCYALLMLTLVPRTSSAVQLHWSSGSIAVSFTEATRCTLVVEADSLEQRLPSEWRLLWLADGCDLRPTALDPQSACVGEQAQVSEVDDPGTAADSAAHLLTAHFCSSGEQAATLAQFVLDLPSGSHGRLRVVALDPSDPSFSQVIQSNEVVFNGGVTGDYPPVILSATTSRISSQFSVHVVGSGLAGANSVSIAAPDGRWRMGLAVSEQSDSALTASAAIPANVPASILEVADTAAVASTALPADVSYSPENATWAPNPPMQETFTQSEMDAMATVPPSGRIQPKDFAFLFAQHKFHLFYIRLNMWDSTYRAGRSDSTEKNLGHAWSSDLIDWHWSVPTRDTTVLQVRPGKWDSFHVWAPYIVQTDSLFYMFYTGVGDTVVTGNKRRHHQRLGVATSPDLDNWTRYDLPLLTAPEVPWAWKAPPDSIDSGSQQLRDPFVMPDPFAPGHWLMYFVAADSLKRPAMAVGVAHSSDLFRWTADDDPIRSTDRDAAHAMRIESPHAFSHEDRWWLCFTPSTPFVRDTIRSDGSLYSPVSFIHTDSLGNPADSIASHWSNPQDTLWHQYDNGSAMAYWHASEYLHEGPHEYLAAWDDWNMGIAVGELVWTGPWSFVVGSPSVAYLGAPGKGGGGDGWLNLALSGAQPARSALSLRVGLPTPSRARLVIFDVAGRRVRTVLDRELPAGGTVVQWDGRDQRGDRVGSGIYFARLSCSAGERVVKGVLLR